MNLTTTDRSVKRQSCPLPPSADPDPDPPSRPSETPSALLLDNIETTVANTTPCFQDRKRSAVDMSKRFKRIGLENKGRKIGQCSDLVVKRSFSCGHASVVRQTGNALAYRCKQKLCPICDHARSVKLSNRLGNALASYVKQKGLYTYHLVLTFRNSDQLPDYARIRKLARRLFDRKAKGRRDFWNRYGYHGALMNFETTVDKQGRYHPHFHILLITERPIELIETGEHEGEFQNRVNQEVSDLWHKITGDSYIVKGKAFEFSGMFEMVKYMTKGVKDIPDSQLYDLVKWSEGKRFLSLIGKLYANEELQELIANEGEQHDQETCPECGCNEYVDIPLLYDWKTSQYHECHTEQGCKVETDYSPP